MALAVAWAHHRPELTADFQQHYGINVWDFGLDGEETTDDVIRASYLLVQLPPKARLACLEDPDNAWDEQTRLLWLIEYEMRILIRSLSGKGKNPEPIKTPSENKKNSDALASAERAREEVDAALADLLPWAKQQEGGDA